MQSPINPREIWSSFCSDANGPNQTTLIHTRRNEIDLDENTQNRYYEHRQEVLIGRSTRMPLEGLFQHPFVDFEFNDLL
jgi:hypothetical protein